MSPRLWAPSPDAGRGRPGDKPLASGAAFSGDNMKSLIQRGLALSGSVRSIQSFPAGGNGRNRNDIRVGGTILLPEAVSTT